MNDLPDESDCNDDEGPVAYRREEFEEQGMVVSTLNAHLHNADSNRFHPNHFTRWIEVDRIHFAACFHAVTCMYAYAHM